MPSTKVIKQKPVEATTTTTRKTKPVNVKVDSEQSKVQQLVPAVRKSRAWSCSRAPQQRVTCEERERGKTVRPCCERRARSSSTHGPIVKGSTHGPILKGSTATRVTTERKKVTNSGRHDDTSTAVDKRQTNGFKEAESKTSKYHTHSSKAFTVIPPNPKKRKEIQKNAAAELAALEELRLSRAMAYVSIDPSSVGGCLSLEEVRLKAAAGYDASQEETQTDQADGEYACPEKLIVKLSVMI